MKPTSFSIYRVVRIDGTYDADQKSLNEAADEAISMVIAEAKSNALYNGEQDGVSVSDVEDCGESM